MKEYNVKNWVNIVLFNLFILSLLGLFLRAMQNFSFGKLNFHHFLHAHSHFAFAGWGFLALAIAIYNSFITEKTQVAKRYNRIFITGLLMAYGMLFSFPFKGYALVSISFSILFIIVSYWFGWCVLKDLKTERKNIKVNNRDIATLFLRAAIFFLIISTLGALAMGPIMATGNGGSHFYFNSIYFYLHFQYNGWFIFGIFALFFKWLEEQDIYYNPKYALWFYRLMLCSAVLTYLLSTLWTKPNYAIFYVAGIGGAIQLSAIIPLWLSLRQSKTYIIEKLHPLNKLIGIGLILLFLLKLLLQFFSVIPIIVEWTVAFRPFVIGYLHLVLLGFFTFFLMAWFIQKGFLLINKLTKYGLIIFSSGFLITEILLFSEGSLMIFGNHISWFYRLMFYFTVFLPIGIGLLLYGNNYNKRNVQNIIKQEKKRFNKLEFENS